MGHNVPPGHGARRRQVHASRRVAAQGSGGCKPTACRTRTQQCAAAADCRWAIESAVQRVSWAAGALLHTVHTDTCSRSPAQRRLNSRAYHRYYCYRCGGSGSLLESVQQVQRVSEGASCSEERYQLLRLTAPPASLHLQRAASIRRCGKCYSMQWPSASATTTCSSSSSCTNALRMKDNTGHAR
jgi:hypothetical protein